MSVSFFNSSDSYFTCFKSQTAIPIFMSFVITYVFLLLPLISLVIYLAFQQWKKQCYKSSAATISHSDFFTYNVVGLELISILGYCLLCIAAYNEGQLLHLAAVTICSITGPGQTLFHLLTCVERYLAVVHPITYLALKQASGVRIRNVSAVCIWLLCVGLFSFSELIIPTFSSVTVTCIMVFSLILLFFCSFSILHVLNHAGPGQVRGEKKRVDQSKQRAFHTIVAIMVAQMFRFVGNLISNIMFSSPELTDSKCIVGLSTIWWTLPCSLVLPLLFLQRAEKLPGCKGNAKSRNQLQ